MTNEQAIKFISKAIYPCSSCESRDECNRGHEALCDGAMDMAIAALRAQDTPNPPLTREELRGMDGEPVWCKNFEMWALIYCHEGWDPILMLANGSRIFNRPARHYTLYRRKPEEE